jgi:hypothetical protein
MFISYNENIIEKNSGYRLKNIEKLEDIVEIFKYGAISENVFEKNTVILNLETFLGPSDFVIFQIDGTKKTALPYIDIINHLDAKATFPYILIEINRHKFNKKSSYALFIPVIEKIRYKDYIEDILYNLNKQLDTTFNNQNILTIIDKNIFLNEYKKYINKIKDNLINMLEINNIIKNDTSITFNIPAYSKYIKKDPEYYIGNSSDIYSAKKEDYIVFIKNSINLIYKKLKDDDIQKYKVVIEKLDGPLLSISRLAKKINSDYNVVFNVLSINNLINGKDITEKGELIGGKLINGENGGSWTVWPENILKHNMFKIELNNTQFQISSATRSTFKNMFNLVKTKDSLKYFIEMLKDVEESVNINDTLSKYPDFFENNNKEWGEDEERFVYDLKNNNDIDILINKYKRTKKELVEKIGELYKNSSISKQIYSEYISN